MKPLKEWVKDMLPDRLYLDLQFLYRYKRLRRHKRPSTFQELLLRKKLDDRKRHRELSRYVDKYEVRDYVRQTVGEEYLVPVLGVYEDPASIDFDLLPNSFVLKGAHGSAMNILVPNKDELDRDLARRMAENWLATDYSRLHRESPYRSLKRRVIVEKNLSDADGNAPVDYKFFVFSGVARLLEVDYGRFTDHVQAFFTPKGERLAVHRRKVSTGVLPKLPDQLGTMVEVAEQLGAGHEFIRIDLYCVGERIYFGEMTLYPAAGLVLWKPGGFEDELAEVWLGGRHIAESWLCRE